MENFPYATAFDQGGVPTDLNEFSQLCHELAVRAGWHDKPREDGTFIALIHSEISEALEGLRKPGTMDKHLQNREVAEVELADTLIRIFDFAGLKGYDLQNAVLEKLSYNQIRQDHKKETREAFGGKTF